MRSFHVAAVFVFLTVCSSYGFSVEQQPTLHSKQVMLNRTNYYPAYVRVAFFARISGSVYRASAHQPIVFNSVTTNIGNGYSHRTGVFRAPVPGIYSLSSSLLASSGSSTCAELSINGNALAKTCSYTKGGNWDNGAGTIVVHMNKGDSFAVRNLYAGSVYYGDLYGFVSGFLINEMWV